MKTLGELEAENPDGFRNPTRTPEQEAQSAQIRARKWAYEKANTPLDLGQDAEPDDEPGPMVHTLKE
jgi:hypothetical protein